MFCYAVEGNKASEYSEKTYDTIIAFISLGLAITFWDISKKYMRKIINKRNELDSNAKSEND